MIVEDHPDTRDALQALLTAYGYDVICALDGAEALTITRREPRPAVIVLDLNLPRMDGDEFRRLQCADPTIAEIPVVAVSSVDDLGRRARALRVSDYLRKPFEVERLLAILDESCRRGPEHPPASR